MISMNLFDDLVAILNPIVSNSYYEMLRGQISIYLPHKHPRIAIWNNRIENGCRITEKIYCAVPENIHTPATDGIGISWG